MGFVCILCYIAKSAQYDYFPQDDGFDPIYIPQRGPIAKDVQLPNRGHETDIFTIISCIQEPKNNCCRPFLNSTLESNSTFQLHLNFPLISGMRSGIGQSLTKSTIPFQQFQSKLFTLLGGRLPEWKRMNSLVHEVTELAKRESSTLKQSLVHVF